MSLGLAQVKSLQMTAPTMAKQVTGFHLYPGGASPVYGPGYGILLGLFFMIFGVNPVAALVLQIVISGVNCLLVYLLGRDWLLTARSHRLPDMEDDSLSAACPVKHGIKKRPAVAGRAQGYHSTPIYQFISCSRLALIFSTRFSYSAFLVLSRLTTSAGALLK